MSAGFTQGFCDNQRPSSKVLRPPGGGSSDIFGSDNPNTPRNVRNHMASNIFGSTQDGPVKNNGDMRRGGRDGDSHSRLFGGNERAFTPAKNHMKSNIALGGDSPKTTNGNSAATNGHTNGKAENNNAANGQQNGSSKTEIEASPIDPGAGDSNETQSSKSQETTLTPVGDSSSTNINSNSLKGASHAPSNEISQSNAEEQSKETTNENDPSKETDKLSITANNTIGADRADSKTVASPKQEVVGDNAEINGNNMNGSHSEKSSQDGGGPSNTTSSVASPVSGFSDITDQSDKSMLSSGSSLRSPRALAGSRNPVTGVGIDMPLYKRTRVLRRDGNPVTGEGYIGGGEMNGPTSLNGAKQVINKNRIPPGGYSSGLW